MKKGMVIGLFALAMLGFTGSAFAGLPCAAYSNCELGTVALVGCSTTDIIWSPSNTTSAGYVVIRGTVKDCLDNPIDTCRVRLDLSASFDANNDVMPGVSGRVCGTSSRTTETDANGYFEFAVTGGGTGAFIFDWTITALCADPEVEICVSSDTLCAKSYDYNGSGNINFFDTFKYLPQLIAGAGYSSDFAACNTSNMVNFFDTFKYLPRLIDGDPCVGGSFLATSLEDQIYECDDIF